MSASPMARQVVETRAIPIKRVLVNDPSELPSHYSQTPGGTMFSTTPGGTKIVYEKNFLMNLRNSPISRTPPIAEIPESLLRGSNSPPKKNNNHSNYYNNNKKRNSLTTRRNSNSTENRKNSWREEDDNNQFQLDL